MTAILIAHHREANQKLQLFLHQEIGERSECLSHGCFGSGSKETRVGSLKMENGDVVSSTSSSWVSRGTALGEPNRPFRISSSRCWRIWCGRFRLMSCETIGRFAYLKTQNNVERLKFILHELLPCRQRSYDLRSVLRFMRSRLAEAVGLTHSF